MGMREASDSGAALACRGVSSTPLTPSWYLFCEVLEFSVITAFPWRRQKSICKVALSPFCRKGEMCASQGGDVVFLGTQLPGSAGRAPSDRWGTWISKQRHDGWRQCLLPPRVDCGREGSG